MELKNLRTLVAIADHGNFSAAGEAVRLTQSAVSLQVKALEKELGTSLFDRSRRPHVLNEKGIDLVRQSREILRNCAELKRSVANNRYEGLLKLGVIPTVCTGVLPSALKIIQTKHPHLVVELTNGLSSELATRVQKGTLDVAIITEPVRLNTDMSWHPFVSEPLMVVAPRQAREQTDTELLQAWPFIRFQRATWAGQLIDANLRDRNIEVRSNMEMDSLEAINSMVAAGLGVSIVPRRSIAQPFPPGVTATRFGNPSVNRVVGLIVRSSNPKSMFTTALHQTLCDLSARFSRD